MAIASGNFLSIFRTVRFILLCSVAIVTFITYVKIFDISEMSRKLLVNQAVPENREFLVYTKGCRIPKYDPFDASVIVHFKNKTNALKACERKSYLMVDRNRVYPKKREIKEDFGKSRVVCVYQNVTRAVEETELPRDWVVHLQKGQRLYFGEPIDQEFIRVVCFQKKGRIFEDYLTLGQLKPEVEEVRAAATKDNLSDEPLSVILLAIDSISKLNYVRHFRKTNDFLSDVLRPFEFHGHTKVADNTFVNIVPMLTGRFVSEYRIPENISRTYYDDLDYVWKEYASAGYRTFYAEDSPNIGTFVFNKKGFVHPPTDYYFRPMALAAESTEWRTKYGPFCFGHTSEPGYYFDYLQKFLEAMGNRSFFAFTFVSRVTHNYLNNAGYIDEYTFDLLQNMYASGVLNRTALIFFSDHGIRFGPILNSFIGKIEERMPFMFQYYPEWFLEKYPEAAKSLSTNQRRLTTPFDVHRTLQDILLMSVKDEKIGSFKNKVHRGRGLSLFKEIPPSRTCADADIHPHWCACRDRSAIPNDDSRALDAAKAMVQKINEWTNSSLDDSPCAFLYLEDVIDAYVAQPSDPDSETTSYSDDVTRPGEEGWSSTNYLITARVAPSGGVFEGTLALAGGKFVVLGDVSRVNRYGNQSWCVNDFILKKFCFCKTPPAKKKPAIAVAVNKTRTAADARKGRIINDDVATLS